jgi:hypothetical protein
MECSPGDRRIDNGTHKEVAMSQILSPLVPTTRQVASARSHIGHGPGDLKNEFGARWAKPGRKPAAPAA